MDRIWWNDVSKELKQSPLIATHQDAETGATSVLVMFDERFGISTGGMQIRGDDDLMQGVHLDEYTLGSAACGSIKCWLNELPICGGKLVIRVPRSLLTNLPELSKLCERVGKHFAHIQYWAKPDVGTGIETAFLAAYATGGGKIVAGIHQLDALGDRTAHSVVGGLVHCLEVRYETLLAKAEVTVLSAEGRLGRKMLALFRRLGVAQLNVATFHGASDALASEFDARVIHYNDALTHCCDILCVAGPPRHITAEHLHRVRAKVVGGPGNDWAEHPSCYSIQDEVVALCPGALLTAASMYHPHHQIEAAATLDEVFERSRRNMDSVIRLIGRDGGNEFEVMLSVAKKNRAAMSVVQ